MSNETQLIDLGIGEDMLQEKIRDALQDAVLNVLDPNTPAKKPRTVTLSITLTPLSNDRRQCAVKIVSVSKLQPRESAETVVFVGVDENGQAHIGGENPRQDKLPFNSDFEDSDNDKVLTMKGRK